MIFSGSLMAQNQTNLKDKWNANLIALGSSFQRDGIKITLGFLCAKMLKQFAIKHAFASSPSINFARFYDTIYHHMRDEVDNEYFQNEIKHTSGKVLEIGVGEK